MKRRFLLIIIICLLQLSAVMGQAFSITVKQYIVSCSYAALSVKMQNGVAPYQTFWSNGATGDSVSSISPGTYSVMVIDNGTPQDTAREVFVIEPIVCKVNFSNRFTPNGDGISDTWSTGKLEEYPNFFLQVFDRWGQVVHQQRKQYTPWDGTQLGVKVPEGTYYYIFYYEEGRSSKIEKGSVTIVR